MPAAFDIGDSVPLSYELFEEDGTTPADATVSLTVTLPDGTTTSPAVTHAGTGVYTASYPPAVSGTFRFRFAATGALTDAAEGAFTVRRQGSNVISVQDVEARLNKTVRDLLGEDEIQAMIDAALSEYETFVGPLPGSVTEVHDGGQEALILASPAATAVTAAAYTDGTAVTLTDLTVRNGIVRWAYGTAGRFTWGSQNVEVTYLVGGLPANHREAIIADVAGYFAVTQRGPADPADFPGESGYEDAYTGPGMPQILFPRIRALAPPAVA